MGAGRRLAQNAAVTALSNLANGWPLRQIREIVPNAWAAAQAFAPADPADK